MSQERCYDCGRLLTEDEIRRVTVVTGGGYVTGQTTGHGYISGSSTVTTKVSVCPACENLRAIQEKEKVRSLSCFVWTIWLTFFGIAAIIIACAALRQANLLPHF